MAVPSAMKDLSTTASSNSPAGSENPISTDDFHRAIQAILRHTNAKGSDIASASSIDLGAATGEFVDVTGTTTITALGTIVAGIVRTVRFTGALTLTHNATSLILPTGANITTANGDVAMFRSLGSGNWKCVNYIRQSGTPLANNFTVTSQTAVTIASDDYVLIADTSDSNNNKKALVSDITPASATTTTSGIVELATDAEVVTGTDTDRVPSVASMRNSLTPLGDSGSLNSGTGVTVGSIPSWVTEINITIDDVSTTSTSQMAIQLGDSGGLESTGYQGIASTAGGTDITSTSHLPIVGLQVAADNYNGTVTLRRGNGNTWTINGNILEIGTTRQHFCAGIKTLSDTLTQLSITCLNGTNNFDGSGTYAVRWR